MKVTIVAFASASDVLGEGESTLELPASSSVADLKALLERTHAGVASLWSRLAVAVNGELADDDTSLAEGDEVALLPPVSGGADRASVLRDGPLDVSEVVRCVEDPSCGAIVVFLGDVRDHQGDRRVRRITYSAYRPMAERRIHRILSDLEGRFSAARVHLVHRLGDIEAGETSVVIAAATPHREDAYEASREALERLKAEVPIWKKEHYEDGDWRWREEEPLARSQHARERRD